MVSKIIKKTPPSPRSIKDSRSRRRKRTPVKSDAAASAVITSVFNFRRRLLKIFSKLARIGSPRPRAHQRYHCLSKLLPTPTPEKKTVFLDLDETLVHSTNGPPPQDFDFIVRPVINGEVVTFYVRKRPGVDEFLAALGRKFEVVVFTAGIEEYASLVLDELDPTAAVIAQRFYRDSCTQSDGRFVKDLSRLGMDLGRVVIVDDNPCAYALQPENGIPVRPFVGDPWDRELRRLIKFFDGCDFFDDMRDAAEEYRSGERGGSVGVGL